RPYVIRHVPDVHVHARDHAAVREPEGDELAPREVATEDQLVTAGGIADELHPDVVLVGEEVRQAVVGGRLSEHRLRGDRRLVERVGPVLYAYAPVVERVLRAGHVTGGADAG